MPPSRFNFAQHLLDGLPKAATGKIQRFGLCGRKRAAG